MEQKSELPSYFSITPAFVLTAFPLPYDLHINSSGLEGHEHFIRIFKKGGTLGVGDAEGLQKKYLQLYVSEEQRGDYLKSLCKIAGKTEAEKTTVLKDSAIQYLGTLYDHNRDLTVEAFNEALDGCRYVVEGLVDVLQSYNVDRLQELIASLSFHDFYTYDHSINVSMYCIVLYRALHADASQAQIMNAGFGGLLHDLGKIRIPTQIINKAGKLSKEEFDLIKTHPALGLEMLSESGLKVPEGIDVRLLMNVVYQHHENFDGTGYPNHMAGDKIDLCARICAVADFFDAITTKRSYHTALSTPDALAMMKDSVGKKLDPLVFSAFAKQTESFDFKRSLQLALDQDFDPCQPHNHLPLKDRLTPVRWNKPAEQHEKSYGKIIMKAPPKAKARRSA